MKSNQNDRLNTGDSKNVDSSRSGNLRSERNSSSHENNSEEFPGYPHYPAKEDIMHPANRMEKISPDPENLTKSGAYVDPKSLEKPVSSSLEIADEIEDDLLIVPGTDADVTRDDLIILGEQDLETDLEEAVDEKIYSGDIDAQLDVPGEELDDQNESLGEEDEENNYYSLGGDRQENLEEN
ncbi:MAG: hypothetical protein ACXWCG_06790 [Flavitalea sp.]